MPALYQCYMDGFRCLLSENVIRHLLTSCLDTRPSKVQFNKLQTNTPAQIFRGLKVDSAEPPQALRGLSAVHISVVQNKEDNRDTERAHASPAAEQSSISSEGQAFLQYTFTVYCDGFVFTLTAMVMEVIHEHEESILPSRNSVVNEAKIDVPS
ncbi:hypothetical protein PAMP_016826 [Pampus punctatissimus]